jgi:hypothetical protein
MIAALTAPLVLSFYTAATAAPDVKPAIGPEEILVTARHVYVGEALKRPYAVTKRGRDILIHSARLITPIGCDEIKATLALHAALPPHVREDDYIARIHAEHHERSHTPRPGRPAAKPPFTIRLDMRDGPISAGDDTTRRAYRALAQARIARNDKAYRDAVLLCD